MLMKDAAKLPKKEESTIHLASHYEKPKAEEKVTKKKKAAKKKSED